MKTVRKRINLDGSDVYSVQATAQEVDQAFNRAQIAFAKQMGVRPKSGVSVEQSVKEQLGITDLDSIVCGQVIEFIVPFAIENTGIMPAYPPETPTSVHPKRGSSCTFELAITPRPHYELPSYEPVSFRMQRMTLDLTAVDSELERLRHQFAHFVPDAPHPVRSGDACKLRIAAFSKGKPIPGLTFDGRTYVAGTGMMPEAFDKAVIGMNVGETKTFSFDGPDIDEHGNQTVMTVDCTVTVLQTQKEQLPELTDEWVLTYMPTYRSLKDLTDKITINITEQQLAQYERTKRDLAAAELAKRFTGRIDDAAYEAMAKGLINNLQSQVMQDGSMTWDQFVEQQGGQQQFNMLLMLQVRQMLQQGYALDALFAHEHLKVTEEDMVDACRTVNPYDPASVRSQLETEGRSFMIREEAERICASRWLAEHADITYIDDATPSAG